MKALQERDKELAQRDAAIRDLLQRVEKLERTVGSGTTAAAAPAGRRAPSASSPSTTAPPPATAPSSAPAAQSRSQQPTSPSATASAAGQPAAGAASKPPAPGQFDVDEQAAERALERTLVATGALLVPEGFVDIEPAFNYTRREFSSQILFNASRNEYYPGLSVRIGLPFDAQFELSTSYNIIQQQLSNGVTSPAQLISRGTGNGFGDLTAGFAKVILQEDGWIPDVIGRVSWQIPTGTASSNGIAMPGHQQRLGGSLTAIKRQDPLVFVASAGYLWGFEENNVTPGNQLNFNLGAFLATSPETTLRAVLTQSFINDVTLRGQTIPGSNQVQSILTFGASSILGRNLLVDLQAGVGLTQDAPKYIVILSFSYRFSL
jgi:hypothetical protein